MRVVFLLPDILGICFLVVSSLAVHDLQYCTNIFQYRHYKQMRKVELCMLVELTNLVCIFSERFGPHAKIQLS